MARPVSASEAKKLSKQHRRILQQLSETAAHADTAAEDVKQAAVQLAEQQTRDLMQNIPVEELSRAKQGLRIKALRDSGFCTVADVHSASAARLAAVNGISDEGAAAVKKQAEEFAAATRQQVSITLSADQKTPAASALVETVFVYRSLLPQAEFCRQVLQTHQSAIEQALADLKPATGSLKWLFASKQAQANADYACGYLTSLLTGDYGTRCSQVLSEHILPDKSRAWEDFTADPIAYFTVLEQLVPELSGGSDTVYGLPEDLAHRVQQQELHLDGLRCTLRRYQQWGVRYILCQERVLLGDEMGLGKTVQAIAAMVSLHNTGSTHFLVVCPASVLTNWCREIKKFCDLTVTKIHGADRLASMEHWLETGGVGVTTFETTAFFRLDPAFRCSMVIVDEAHYIKNPAAQRTVNTRKLCAQADRILFMSGTALENNVDEMIELLQVLRPEVAQQVRSIAFLSTAPQFREKVAPVYYRRKRADVLTELPELIENLDWCELSGEEETRYEDAVLRKKYTEARRVSWNVDDLSQSSKAQRLKEIIEDAEEDGRKVIVFSFFLDTIAKIGRYFPDRCMTPINGSVPPQKRQEILDAFDKAPAGSVLIAQIQSGGTGLNIQTASVVVLCEPQFKPSIENQAISRAYRMGQARNVLVHRLLCDDTVDEKILEVLEQKQQIFDAFANDSVAAEDSLELDMNTFGQIMEEETRRIEAKRSTEAAPTA